MPGVPSTKACDRCKKRHVKCDGLRPDCRRCTAAGVQCPGYVQMRKFIDQGATLRRQYAPYHGTNMRSASRGCTTGAGRSSRRPAPAEASVEEMQIEGRRHADFRELGLTHAACRDKTSESLSQSLRPAQSRIRPVIDSGDPIEQLENLNHVSTTICDLPCTSEERSFAIAASGPRETRPGSPLYTTRPSLSPADVVSSPELSAALDSSQLPSYSTPVSSLRATPQDNRSNEVQNVSVELSFGAEHELAYLVRHFSDVLSSWLDISDAGKFFGVVVPVRALDSIFLKYAVAALVARHLGQRKGATIFAAGATHMDTATSDVSSHNNASDAHWLFKAANYYYLAVSHMSTAISSGYATISSSAVLESPIERLGHWLARCHASYPHHAPTPSSETSTPALKQIEDLLATVTILTVYKLLETRGQEWQRHLNGIKPLFDSLLRSRPALNNDGAARFSPGVSACFWNFARQDYLASYFTRTPTHFKSHDLALWQAAGAPLDRHGALCFSQNPALANGDLSREHLATRGLIWLLSKMINFLARFKQSQLEQWGILPISSPSPEHSLQVPAPLDSTNLAPSTATWMALCFEFQKWIENLPETFRACIRTEKSTQAQTPLADSPDSSRLFTEVYYSLPTCAAAMQHYHFGRLALLLNRPPDQLTAPSTAFDRLQEYRELMKEVDYRCREICGIALGRPHESVRAHMAPLLFAVGQCLEKDNERQLVTRLLQAIEADLGCITSDLVGKLEEFWFSRQASRP